FVEITMAVSFEVVFSMGVGVLFTILADKPIKTKHYLLLGLSFGGAIWLFITAVIKVFRLTQLQTKNLSDPLITFMLSVAYGLLLTVIDHRLKNRKSGS
ncbi:MAG TPA: hypothetical protein DDW50_07665, partial [Firmicutes bacterium]|nr:hypothetical protein [Bacillota bacterium]